MQLAALQHVIDIEQHHRHGDAERRAVHDEDQQQAAEQPVLERREEGDEGVALGMDDRRMDRRARPRKASAG